jgi:hypothetical protein
MSGELSSMTSYRSNVEKVAEIADGRTILNRSPDHASIILEWVFNKSSDCVEILTSELSEKVYGKPELISAARRFLEKPRSRIEIIAEQPVDRWRHAFLSELDRAGFEDRVRLRFIPEDSQKQYSFNFAVGDGRHFRFEQSRLSYEAVAQFGSVQVGNKLHEIFEDLLPDRAVAVSETGAVV